jgi:uncharacterized protein (DUF2267 family)
MIKKVQQYSGFSDSESENALVAFISILSKRLTPDERMDFASQLPAELQDTVVSVEMTNEDMTMEDMLETMADEQNIDEDHAKKQVMAAWQTLKDAIGKGEIEDIRSQLPKDMTAQLYG